MFKIVRQSVIDDYRSKILELRIDNSQLLAELSKANAKPQNERIAKLEAELRAEKRRRELAEASVKALEAHLRVLRETKK